MAAAYVCTRSSVEREGRAGGEHVYALAILSQFNETPWAHPSRYSVGVPVLVTFPCCTEPGATYSS